MKRPSGRRQQSEDEMYDTDWQSDDDDDDHGGHMMPVPDF